MRWRGRGAAAALVAAAVVLGSAGPASAHAYLVGSDPADGSVLAAAPAAITLRFSESVQQRATAVELLAGSGQRIAVTSVQLRRPGGAAGDTEQPVEIVVGLPPLPPDTYRVSWRTLSSDDLHATSGVLVFGVQRDVTAAARAADPAPPPGEVALRWLGLLGTAALLGGLLLALLAGRVGAPPELRRRTARLAAAGGVAAAGLAAALLLEQAGGGTASRLLTTAPYGPRWLTREASLLVLVAIAMRLAAGRRVPLARAAAGLAVGVLGVTSALLGHASAVSGSRPVWLLADGAHLVTALTWVGGVGLAGLVLGPALHRPDQRASAVAVLRAFGTLATGGVVLLVVTGLLLTGGAVASLDALLLSSYGRTLLIKLALAGLAGLAALRTRKLLRARADRTGAAIRREALVLTTVLGAAAALAAVAPALGPRFAAPAGIAPVASGQAGDLVEALSVRPNRPGRNVIGLGVFDSRRPAPGPVTGVSVSFRAPDGTATVARSARRADDGDWTVTVDDLRMPGRWRLTVTALRAGLPPSVAGFDWAVADPAARPPLVSAARLAGPLDGVAAALVVLAATAAGLVVRQRRRFRVEPDRPSRPGIATARVTALASAGSTSPRRHDE